MKSFKEDTLLITIASMFALKHTAEGSLIKTGKYS